MYGSHDSVDMRDGIYKGLSLGRHWKRLLRWCEREADRGERTANAAEQALRSDLERQVSLGLIQDLRLRASALDSMLPGFFSADLINHDALLDRERTPFEDIVLKGFARNASAGLAGNALVDRSFADAISEWKRRHLKSVQEHYMCEAGDNASRQVIAALKAALDAVDGADLAKSGLAGARPKKVVLKPVDPNEDLR
jgi:hypothetical protein